MTTEQTVATNATALRNLAARLERMGYTGGDAHAEAEHIALNLLADGYRRLEPVPAKGDGGSAAAREAALEATREAVATARERRTTGGAA